MIWTNECSEQDIQIATLYCRGLAPAELAERFKLSFSELVARLRAIRKMWLERIRRTGEDILADVVTQIDHVCRAAWEGWRRSQKCRRKRVKTRKIKPARGSDEQVAEKGMSATVESDQPGDPRFLQLVVSCIDKTCKLFDLWGVARKLKRPISRKRDILMRNAQDMTLEQLQALADLRKGLDEATD